MQKKTLVLIGTAALSLVLTTAAFAASYANPGEIVSALTGKTQVEVTTERSQGKTYGQIAQENGKLEEFQNEMLEHKKAVIDERVKSGVITEENGAALKKAIEERKANCIGTPGANQERLGQKFGGGMGSGKGQGGGKGMGRMGQGQMGQGMGLGRNIAK